MERGEEGLQVLRNHVVEHRMARIPGVRSWQLLAPYEPPRTAGREWKCRELPSNILLKYSVYKQKIGPGMRRKHAGRIALPCGGGGKKCVWNSYTPGSAIRI